MTTRTRIGIRARLFLAFGAVAAMTIIATVTAWLAFSNLSDSLGRVANVHVPAMTIAAQLAETGGAIIATAPTLIAAADNREKMNVLANLTVLMTRMTALLDAMQAPLVDRDSRSSLQELVGRIAANLKTLDTNVDHRFELSSRKAELIERLQWLHTDFLDEIEPMVDEARFNIDIALATTEFPIAKGETDGMKRLRWEMTKRDALSKINAAGNRATGLLLRMANTDTEEDIQFTSYQLGEIRKELESDLAVMQGLASSVSLRQIVFGILSYAGSDQGLARIHSDELDTFAEGRRLLANNQELVARLKEIIGQRVSALEVATKETAAVSIKSIARGKVFLAAIATASLLIAVLAGWIYVGRYIVGRITALGGSMRAIADGDLTTKVPIDGDDEIAEMANALEVFRNTAIEVEEANAEAIIDNTMAGMVATSRAGIIEFFNPSAEALFGYGSEDIIGRELTDLIDEAHRDAVRGLLEGSSAGGSRDRAGYLEAAGRRADGSTFPMDLAIREFQQRQRVRFMVTVHDVTERRHAQELLEQRVLDKTTDLRDANRRLRREIGLHRKTETELRNTQDELIQASKLAALGKISAGIAHELNQPLAAIRAYAHNGAVLIDRERNDEARDNFDRISAMTKRMGDITTHLKTFARRPSTETETVNLRTTVTNALSLFQDRIAKEGVAVELKFPRSDLLATGEDIRMEQVVINLLANAVDAMAESALKELRVVGRRRGGRVMLDIADTGCGIGKADLARIFDPFFTTKEQGRGLGLGLSISHKIVRDFGGTIRARSSAGKGAVFTLSFPAVNENASNG